MPQQQTGVTTKTSVAPNNILDHVEFNQLNNTVNLNASNAEARLASIEGTSIPIQSYTSEDLPTSPANGTIALDLTEQTLVYAKNNSWYKLSDNSEILILEGFTFQIKTDLGGTSNSDQFTLPLIAGNVYSFTVNWGDGNEETITSDSPFTHTYASAGTYVISITGVIQGFKFDNSGDQLKLLAITDWGTLSYNGDASDAFYGCNNLVNSASNAPDTSTSNDFIWFFFQCSSLTSVPLLDLSSGDRYFAMFRGCSNVGTLPTLDFTSGTNSTKFRETFREMALLTTLDNCTFGDSRGDIRLMFRDCTSLLNIPPSLVTTNCSNMQQTFYGCSSFTSIPLLDTPNVANFERAFQGCSGITSFPQLDFSSGHNIGNAFNGCTSLVDFPLLDFSSATNFSSTWQNCALNSASVDNIMAALVAAGKSNLLTSLAGGTTIPYSSWSTQAQADYATLISRGWTILTN